MFEKVIGFVLVVLVIFGITLLLIPAVGIVFGLIKKFTMSLL